MLRPVVGMKLAQIKERMKKRGMERLKSARLQFKGLERTSSQYDSSINCRYLCVIIVRDIFCILTDGEIPTMILLNSTMQ